MAHAVGNPSFGAPYASAAIERLDAVTTSSKTPTTRISFFMTPTPFLPIAADTAQQKTHAPLEAVTPALRFFAGRFQKSILRRGRFSIQKIS